jgi:alpha-tubulin suppressor-like RCC1 family protein
MTPVGGFTKVVTSASFSCGIRRDRTVWCWWNYAPGLAYAGDGELGDGTQRASQTPVQVVTSTIGPDPLTDVVSLGTNVTTTCAVRADTTVYCWGNGSMGQFGNGTRTRSSFVATPALARAGGPLFSGADSVCVGNAHVCTHNQDDTVWCWGWNAYEQIGNGTTIDAQYPSEVVALSHRAKQVECGWYYSCARVDERVYCWGYNMYGMGNGTQGRGVAVIKEPGEEPGRGVDFTGVSDLRVTNDTSCILRAPEQSLWCWGQWTDGFEHRYPWQPPIDVPDAGTETLNHPYAWDFGVRACFVTTEGVAFLGDAPAKYPIECPQ